MVLRKLRRFPSPRNNRSPSSFPSSDLSPLGGTPPPAASAYPERSTNVGVASSAPQAAPQASFSSPRCSLRRRQTYQGEGSRKRRDAACAVDKHTKVRGHESLASIQGEHEGLCQSVDQRPEACVLHGGECEFLSLALHRVLNFINPSLALHRS